LADIIKNNLSEFGFRIIMAFMRVIAGSARRMPLKTLAGDATRPTTDRIKETLFNMLQPDIPGCRFLDLFAGSGQMGIEALSRGAVYAQFVDSSRKAAAVIKENLDFTKLGGLARVDCMTVAKALHRLDRFAAREPGKRRFDVVFCDPPYGLGLEKEALGIMGAGQAVADGALVVVESALGTDFGYAQALGFSIEKEKAYKTNKHVFLRKGA
jgi:16S rRNA (guanine966-N2)-methyltransferase